MNEISRLKVENEELFKNVNLIKERIGKDKYYKCENYYVSSSQDLYKYESKGESLAFTAGKVENFESKTCVSLYVDKALVDKVECLTDGTFSLTYILPQTKKSVVKAIINDENAIIKSARTIVMGNVALLYNQTAKVCSGVGGVSFARLKNGGLYFSRQNGVLTYINECQFFDIAKTDENNTSIVECDGANLILCTVQNDTANTKIIKVFQNGEEVSMQDLCAYMDENKLIVVCIMDRKLRYFCFDAQSLIVKSEGEISSIYEPRSICFVKNATTPILIANVSDKNYTMEWIE